MNIKAFFPVLTLLGAALPGLVSAQVNMIIFEGTVVDVGTGVAGDFTAGESISGYFLYDTAATPDPISSTDQAWYDAISLNFRIGGYTGADPAPLAPSEGVFVMNDVSGRDTFSIGVTPNGASVAGLAPEKFRFQIHDPTATVFSDASLPATIDLGDFDTANTGRSYIALTFGTSPGTANQVRGRITRLQVAPPKLMVNYSGDVVSVGSGVASHFSIGQRMTGKFVYNPITPAHAISSADEAWYDAISLRYRFGSYYGGDPTPLSASDGIRVANDFSGGDTFSVGTNSPMGPPVAGLAPDNFRFQLKDPTGSVFGSGALPTALDLGDFDPLNTSLTYAALTFGSAPGIANQVRAQIREVVLEPVGDEDGDGVFDDVDNCIYRPNSSQLDTDSDGIGNHCDADLDNNCVVNFADLGVMKSVFFTSHPHADLDGNGVVNFADLAIMKAQFFGPPGPSCTHNICE